MWDVMELKGFSVGGDDQKDRQSTAIIRGSEVLPMLFLLYLLSQPVGFTTDH